MMKTKSNNQTIPIKAAVACGGGGTYGSFQIKDNQIVPMKATVIGKNS